MGTVLGLYRPIVRSEPVEAEGFPIDIQITGDAPQEDVVCLVKAAKRGIL